MCKKLWSLNFMSSVGFQAFKIWMFFRKSSWKSFSGRKTVFEIHVLSTLAIKWWGSFKNFQFPSAIRWWKICQRLGRNPYYHYAVNCILLYWQWLQHTSAFCQRLWFVFFNFWDYLFYLNYIIFITHLNGWNGRHYFFHW